MDVGNLRPSNWHRRNCPLCGDTKSRVLVSPRARQFCRMNSTYRRDFAALLDVREEEPFPVAECDGCGFVFSAMLPPGDFLDRLYDGVIDQKQAMLESESPARIAAQCYVAQAVCKELQASAPDQPLYRVLDLGCGYGTLLKIIGGSRISATGFDNSASRCERLKERGLNAAHSTDELKSLAPFDAITLVDVLEHVATPVDLLHFCRSLLTPAGIVCVAVPEFAGPRLARLRRAVELDQPFDRDLNPWEHLNYFRAGSLDRILAQCKFSALEPLMPVDVGVRPRLRGVRRIGNCLKSIRRTAHYAVCGSALGVVRIGAKQSG